MDKDFIKLYKEIKTKTMEYNLSKNKEDLEDGLIELHIKLLDKIPELKELTLKNLRVLRGGQQNDFHKANSKWGLVNP